MAPIIEVSDGVLSLLSSKAYTRRADLETQPRPRVEVVFDNAYIEIPELKIAVAKERGHHGKNWYDSHGVLKQEGKRMLTPSEFVGFVNFLKSGEGNPDYQRILKEITEVRSPWRAEWLDAYFEKRNGKMQILTQNRSNPAELEACLMEDCKADVFGSANPQGLPTKKGDTNYWFPRNGSVARFDASGNYAGLGCGGSPGCGNAVLGVREVRDIA